MLKHYLAIALRNLVKQKINSAIKIVGLALGIAATMLVMIVNYSELTWDSFWKEADQVYMVRSNPNGTLFDLMGDFDFQQVREQLVAQLWMTQIEFSQSSVGIPVSGNGSPVSHRINISKVDPDFLSIFQPKVISGDTNDFSKNPNSAVISQTVAKKLFGNENPIGKVVLLSLEPPIEKKQAGVLPEIFSVTIIAVVDIDSPRSNITPALFFPKLDYPVMQREQARFMRDTYIKPKHAMTSAEIHAALQAVAEANLPAQEPLRQLSRVDYSLMPITDIHMKNLKSDGNQKRVVILSLLGVLILAVAISNFISLGLAGYVARQKEVALRRIQGAGILQLLWQYWLETIVYVLLACLLALVICELIAPHLTAELQIPLVESIFVNPLLIFWCALIVLAVSIIVALYPAAYFSRINAATILRANRSTETNASIYTRKILLVVQFVAMSALVIGLISIHLQLKIINNYEPGYKTKDIVMLINQSDIVPGIEKFGVIKQQFAQIPGFVAAAPILGDIPGGQELMMEIGAEKNDQSLSLNVMFDWIADADYFAAFGMQQIAGATELLQASFKPPSSNGRLNPDMNVILCRSTAMHLGFATPEAAIGQSIQLFKQRNVSGLTEGKVVAVVENSHLGSHKKAPMDCMFIALNRVVVGAMPIAVSFNRTLDQQDINAVKKIWEDHTGKPPHQWLFANALADRYKNERRIQLFVSGFALVALIIGLLGIYGITALSTQKRAREIALRKLHGASRWQIVSILNRDFSLLVIAANMIAWPVAIYLVNNWLQDFHKHISLMHWLPVLCLSALGICLLIVWIAATGHSLTISRLRPTEVLRED